MSVKIDVKLPALRRGTVRSRGKSQEVLGLCDRIIQVDVPAFPRNAALPVFPSVRETGVSNVFKTVFHKGRFYAPVGRDVSLCRPGPSFGYGLPHYLSGDIPDGEPLVASCMSRVAALAAFRGYATMRNYSFWPKDVERVYTYHRPRVPVPSEEELHLAFESFLHDDGLAFDALHERTTARLKIFGKTVFIECGAPCLMVELKTVSLDYPEARAGRWDKKIVKITPSFSNDMVDFDLRSRAFPPTRFEDAFDYARALEASVKTDGELPENLARPPIPEFADLCDFDPDEAYCDKVSFLIAANLVRRIEQQSFHDIYEGKDLKLSPADLAVVQEIKQAVDHTIFTERPGAGFSRYFDDALRIWSDLGKPKYESMGLQGNPKVTAFALEEAERLVDTLPIRLDVPSFPLSR